MSASTAGLIAAAASIVLVALVAARWQPPGRGAVRRRLGAIAARQAGSRRTHRFGNLMALRSRRRRRGPPDPSDIAAVLDGTARRCASGLGLGMAFGEAVTTAGLGDSFRACRAALATGEAAADAFARIERAEPNIAFAAHALVLAATQGGDIGETLDRAAMTLRERSAFAAERVAQSAQARLSAKVLTVLPLGFGAWTAASTATVRAFFVTPLGVACVVAGLGLNAAGWLLMRRIAGGAT